MHTETYPNTTYSCIIEIKLWYLLMQSTAKLNINEVELLTLNIYIVKVKCKWQASHFHSFQAIGNIWKAVCL